MIIGFEPWSPFFCFASCNYRFDRLSNMLDVLKVANMHLTQRITMIIRISSWHGEHDGVLGVENPHRLHVDLLVRLEKAFGILDNLPTIPTHSPSP